MLTLPLTVLAGGVLRPTTLTLSLQTITSSASASGLANNNNIYHAKIILTLRVPMPNAREKPRRSSQL